MDFNDKTTPPILAAALADGRLSHAYIVAGADTARTLAEAAVCSGSGRRPCMSCNHCLKAQRRVHPDIITIGLLPDKREIIVDQIRALKEDVIVAPNEAEKKAYIINNADSMNTAAQNALLMVLEEPPRHVMLILTAENPAELLPTVRSRCIEMKNTRLSVEDDEAAREIAEEFFSALEGEPRGLVELSFRLDKLEKQEFAAFITSARKLAAEKLREAALHSDDMSMRRAVRADETLCKAEEYLSLNVGTVHVSGLLCAGLTVCQTQQK